MSGSESKGTKAELKTMAKSNPSITAEIRDVKGRKVRRLRRDGKTPATMYGKEFESMTLQFVTKDLDLLYSDVGESGLVDVMVAEQKYPVLFRNPQYHAVDESLMHIDCFKVNLKEKITANIPIEFIGESDAAKAGNDLVPVTNEVEVEALPADLPEKFEVDISVLTDIDSQITVADLKIDGKYEIITDPTQIVIKIEEHKEEEIPVEAEVAPEEVPATEQKGEPEGEQGSTEDDKKE